MRSYSFSDQAVRDLEEICDYIASNPGLVNLESIDIKGLIPTQYKSRKIRRSQRTRGAGGTMLQIDRYSPAVDADLFPHDNTRLVHHPGFRR